jgi:hypothetical protein
MLQRNVVENLADQYQFFHWHLAFPEVFARGGFDCVLGNPPWERVKLQEQEFFASRSDAIASASNAAARKKLIAQLPMTNANLWREWSAASRKAEGESQLIRQSGRYPMCGKGDINTYAIFAEHNRSVLGPRGALGCILPAGIATDDTTKEFFRSVVSSRTLRSLHHFENEDRVFVGVNNMFRFVMLTVTGIDTKVEAADIVAFARSGADLRDDRRHYSLTAAEIELVNPNTGTFPTFLARRDADINLAMYRRAGVLWRESDASLGNPWGIRFMAMLHMANDSNLFRTRSELEADGGRLVGNRFVGGAGENLPLIEAKMVHLFEHRYATYDGATQANLNKGTLPETTESQRRDPLFDNLPQYWVAKTEVDLRLQARWDRLWLLGWRDITNAHNERTIIASLIPCTAVGHTMPLLMPDAEPPLIACLYANLCSLALDYAARQKVGSTHLTYGYLKQLPVLAPAAYAAVAPWQPETTLRSWLLPRVLELTYTAWDLEPFARDVGYHGPPFRWDPERRFQLRCELDAVFFHLYGLSHDDTGFVLDTFPIVRRKDEEKCNGDYRTKRVILEIYDAMEEAVRTGQPYRTRLDPSPGAPRDTEGNFVRYAQIADNPPPHIHFPRDVATGGRVALQLSDLGTRFPAAPFALRLGTIGNAQTLRVRPVRTAEIHGVNRVALASPKLRISGSVVPAAVGRLRVESRTDAGDGSTYVLVTVRGDDGNAHARFSEEEWRDLTTVGVVEESGEA